MRTVSLVDAQAKAQFPSVPSARVRGRVGFPPPELAPRSIIARKVIISADELDATCNRANARGYEVACRTREADRTNRSRNCTVPTVRIDRPPNGRDRSE